MDEQAEKLTKHETQQSSLIPVNFQQCTAENDYQDRATKPGSQAWHHERNSTKLKSGDVSIKQLIYVLHSMKLGQELRSYKDIVDSLA